MALNHLVGGPVALGLARTLNMRIKLVSAIYELELIAVEKQPVYASVPAMTARDIEDHTEEYLDTLMDRMRHVTDSEITKEILHGPIAPTLEEYAEAEEPDLIVMSTHGRGPLSRLWIGSVADRMVRHVRTPMLLVRPEPNGDVDLRECQPFRDIVVALDGSNLAEKSLARITELAKATGAHVTLFRAVPPPFPVQSPYLPDAVAATREALEAGREEAQRYLAEMAAPLEEQGIRVDAVVVVGVPPAAGILKYLEDSAGDLIAIATHGRGGVARAVLGSVADKVVRGATVPVLLTRPA